jgi:hypothetical protein
MPAAAAGPGNSDTNFICCPFGYESRLTIQHIDCLIGYALPTAVAPKFLC